MRDSGIVIQAWSSLQYGYFMGVFLGSNKYPDRIAAEKGASNAAVALAWILRIPGRMQTVVRTTRLFRVRHAAQACDIALSKKEWYEIYLAAGNSLP